MCKILISCPRVWHRLMELNGSIVNTGCFYVLLQTQSHLCLCFILNAGGLQLYSFNLFISGRFNKGWRNTEVSALCVSISNEWCVNALKKRLNVIPLARFKMCFLTLYSKVDIAGVLKPNICFSQHHQSQSSRSPEEQTVFLASGHESRAGSHHQNSPEYLSTVICFEAWYISRQETGSQTAKRGNIGCCYCKCGLWQKHMKERAER